MPMDGDYVRKSIAKHYKKVRYGQTALANIGVVEQISNDRSAIDPTANFFLNVIYKDLIVKKLGKFFVV